MRRVSIIVSQILGLTVAATYAAPGDLDISFQSTGWTHVPAGPNGAMDIAVQPDGKIVLTGKATTQPGVPDPAPGARFVVWRFHPDGSIDTSFDGTGRSLLTVSVETGGTKVAVGGDGRIFAAGYHVPPGNYPYYLVAAFLPDGRRDLSFGTTGEGFVRTEIPGTPYTLTLQPDGKILVAGGTQSSFMLTRWLPDGTLDPSFDSDGMMALPASGSNGVYAATLAVQKDGKILAARDNYAFTVLRLLPGGSLDPDFGTEGAVSIFPDGPTLASCFALTVMPDGKIVAGGPDYGDDSHGHGFMVARFLPGGTLDPSFGDPGTPGRSYIPADNSAFVFTGMSVQSNGAILMSASVSTPFEQSSTDIMLARFTRTGRPDLSFGVGGRVRKDLGNTRDQCRASALLTDQTLIVAGAWGLPGQTVPQDILLARFEAPVSADLSIEYPPGTELLPWSGPVDFGPVTAGIRIIQMTLQNTGLTTLTNLQAVLVDESVPGDYHAAAPAATTLAPGGQTTVDVSLAPSAAPGVRTASLRLTAENNGLALMPRLIPLTGSKATPLQIWRVTWFGSPDNSGPGADLNDFDGDGLPNFMEYAIAGHPHLPSPSPLRPVPGAAGASFIYNRPSSALTEFSYLPESAASPAGPWSSAGLTTTILTDDGTMQTVEVTPAAGTAAPHWFLRLRVTRL